MIKIILVDDQDLFRKLLQEWLKEEDELEIVGTANNGQQAINKVEELKPDVVIMDVEMPEMDGITATKIIRERFPETKVIVLSSHDEDVYLTKALRAGAKGYILKNNSATAEDISSTIHSVYQGYTKFGPGLFEHIIIHALDDLDRLREKFEEVAPTYNKFKQYLSDAKQKLEEISETEERLNNRFSDFETVNNSKLDEFRNEILQNQNATKITLEKITQESEKLNKRFEEMERLEKELRLLQTQLSDAGFNPKNFTKLERVEDQIRAYTSDVNKINKRFDLLQTSLIITFALVVISTFFSLFQLMFQPDNNNQFESMTQPQQISKLK